MSVSSLTTLGTTLAATCSTEPAGRLAAGWLGAAPDTVVLNAAAVGLRQHGHTTTDTRRHQRDGQRANGQKPCPRTLLGRSRTRRRLHRSGGVEV